MTRRWFGKVIGAIAAACGLPAKSSYSVKNITLHCGVVRWSINKDAEGWVDVSHRKHGSDYVVLVKAKALWDIEAGEPVVVADAFGAFPMIYMNAVRDGSSLAVTIRGARPTSTFTLSAEDGSLERGWQ